jgi:hypothetical protein
MNNIKMNDVLFEKDIDKIISKLRHIAPDGY